MNALGEDKPRSRVTRYIPCPRMHDCADMDGSLLKGLVAAGPLYGGAGRDAEGLVQVALIHPWCDRMTGGPVSVVKEPVTFQDDIPHGAGGLETDWLRLRLPSPECDLEVHFGHAEFLS